MQDYPKVYCAIPTGAPKEYAILYMLASLQNVDYPKDKLSINFAVTNRGEQSDLTFLKHLKELVENSTIPFKVNIHLVKPSNEEKERWGQYYAVICNMHELRKQFLDSDCEYFWVLGGDNPPPRHMLHALLQLETDVASPMIKQRPCRAREFDKPGMPFQSDPRAMFWLYMWHMDDVQKRKDLDPRVKEALRKAWINLPLLRLIKTDKPVVATKCSFGSGCSLIHREVFEHIGYYMNESAYCSEDLSFMQWVHTLGYETRLNSALHCSHFDPNGAIY